MENQSGVIAVSNQSDVIVPELDDFDVLMEVLRTNAKLNVAISKGILFSTKTVNRNTLFETYLSGFDDPSEKQQFNCNCCKQFLRAFGGLVRIDVETGRTHSVLWNIDQVIDKIPNRYKHAIWCLKEIVEASIIDSVFYVQKDIDVVGYSVKGGYSHFAFPTTHMRALPYGCGNRGAAAAVSREAYKTLNQHMVMLSTGNTDLALGYFNNDSQLKCYENFKKNIAWFSNLKRLKSTFNIHRLANNIVWHAVATGSHGQLKFGNTVGGEFIRNLDKGKSFDDAKQQFLSSVDPSEYMRPKAPPSVGNINQAEKIFADLGLEPSTKRRYLRFEELDQSAFVWMPKKPEVVAEKPGGVFDHLLPNAEEKNIHSVDGGKITWERFEREILPNAEKIEVRLDYRRYLFTTVTTAVNPDAPPLFIWDKDDKRNPYSGYMRTNENGEHGSYPDAWNLPTVVRIEVTGIIYAANEILSDDKTSSRILVLEDAHDVRPCSLALFPQILRPELFPVRSTIEAHSNSGVMEDSELGFAGLPIGITDQYLMYRLYVTSGQFCMEYVIDRAK